MGQERALSEAVKAVHPLVIAHLVTGESALFVNPTIASEVVGLKPQESQLLLGFLHDHIRSLDFSCQVSWEKGMVLVWDQVGKSPGHFPKEIRLTDFWHRGLWHILLSPILKMETDGIWFALSHIAVNRKRPFLQRETTQKEMKSTLEFFSSPRPGVVC